MLLMVCVLALKPPGPDQLYELIPGAAVKVVVCPKQMTLAPLMEHIGSGVIVTLNGYGWLSQLPLLTFILPE
jgi:hypothetical protein